MKVSKSFNETIKAHLDGVAAADPLFAEKYNNPKKNLTECVTYILNWVKASGCQGFTDDEIFGQAMHYYDEEKIDIGKPINAQVVVNHHVELSEEEKQAAKQAAIDKVMAEEKAKIANRKPSPKKEVQPLIAQPSLFD